MTLAELPIGQKQRFMYTTTVNMNEYLNVRSALPNSVASGIVYSSHESGVIFYFYF